MACPDCKYYEYKCGVGSSLQRAMGITAPASPTCICHFANIAWARTSAEVRKPRGIACDYTPKEFACTQCGNKVTGSKNIWMTLTPETCVCIKCGAKKLVTEVAAKRVDGQ